MERTVLHIRDMDCPAEEQIIRMKLSSQSVKGLNFDIRNRQLTIFHDGDLEDILSAVHSLDFGTSLIETGSYSDNIEIENTAADKKMLWIVFIINFSLFIAGLTAGLIANSIGLIADALDELADAIVYGLAIYAMSGSVIIKKRIARLSGCVQFILALWGFWEILRRFMGDEPLPDFLIMIIMASIALAGNAASVYLLSKSQTREVHIKAAFIFASNDVIVNAGIIVAAVLVLVLQSTLPDLVVGAVVFLFVFRGALKIFKLAK